MSLSLSDLLSELIEAKVEFILVGGLAAVAQGAPVTTFDVDIVHMRTPENVDRLLQILNKLHAFVREPSERKLPPKHDALMGVGHNLFVTDKGPLDCLGAIEGGFDYDALLSKCIEIEFDEKPLKVVRLETLLEFKERWTDDESKLRASILRRVLERKK